MAIRKNALTTSSVGRTARTLFRQSVRPAVREATIAARRAQGSRHAHAPDFLIVGVQKGGTTALFDGLTASPRFGTPLVKEVHYFNRYTDRPPDWYRCHFWGSAAGQVWGESTPAYFDAPGVAERIVRALPDVKIVITLRDPLARAISHYFHARDFDLEPRSLADAFAAEAALLASGGRPTGDDYLERGYLSRSQYAASLKRWYSLLPPERICVVVAEDRATALPTAARFLLGTDDPSLSVRESNARPYEVPADLDPSAALSVLRPDAEQLPALLGWDSLPSSWFPHER